MPLFVLSRLLSSLWVSRTGSASDWCALQEALYKFIDTIQYNTVHGDSTGTITMTIYLFLLLFIAWHQHDIQELCRVMFDALEKTWQNTEQADLINQLYQGRMKDCVQCLQVKLSIFIYSLFLPSATHNCFIITGHIKASHKNNYSFPQFC